MPWQPGTPRLALTRAAAALQADPSRSDAAIARLAGCAAPTVARARRSLQQHGLIEAIPVGARTRRPCPLPPSRTRDAILAGASTPRQVADAAGVTMQAAWKALQRTRPRPVADVAAATDSISVVRLDGTCERCGEPFARSASGQRRRFCTKACRRAAEIARSAQARREKRSATTTGRPQITVTILPPQPDLSRGSCANGVLPPDYWSSTLPAEREAARLACRSCPVLRACREWALSLPTTDRAIYAGMTAMERVGRKRGLAAATPAPG